MRVHATLARHDQPQWQRRNSLECGGMGCFESRRATIEDIPVIEGRLAIVVSNARSGRTLQEEVVEESESGLDVLAMRLRVLERLRERAQMMVDQRSEEIPVQLVEVDHPEVRLALAALRRQEWQEGRERLERAIGSPSFAALDRDAQAYVHHDLGQAFRFDPSLPESERFAEAERSLRRAVRMAPQPRLAQALAELEQHRRSRAMVREQQAARRHNFALLNPSALPVPDPPRSYR